MRLVMASLVMFTWGVGLVVADAGAPRPVALTGTDGEFGPGLEPGITSVSFAADEHDYASPVMNNSGESVFIATIAGPGITADNDTGIWAYRNGP